MFNKKVISVFTVLIDFNRLFTCQNEGFLLLLLNAGNLKSKTAS